MDRSHVSKPNIFALVSYIIYFEQILKETSYKRKISLPRYTEIDTEWVGTQNILSGTVGIDINILRIRPCSARLRVQRTNQATTKTSASHPETLASLLWPSLSRSELVRDGQSESTSCSWVLEESSEPIAMASLGGG